MYNTSVLNSAYTGSVDNFEAGLIYRTQWVGLEGAPENQSFFINKRIKKHIGIGLNAINDKSGPADNFNFNATFSYQIKTGYRTRLSFGLNAGFEVLQIDWSRGTFSDAQDPIFRENVNQTTPKIGLGVYFHSDRWYVGISDNNLLAAQIYDNNENVLTDRKSQFYVMGGYVLDLSENLKFKPGFLSKHVAGAPITIDASANFLIYEKFSLGAGYRHNSAISALVGFRIKKKFFLGYAYDYSLTELANFSNGSHEIILKYNLRDQRKRAASPRFF